MIDGETFLDLSELFGIISVGIFVVSSSLRGTQNLPLIVALSLIFVELTFIREAISEVPSE